MTTISRRGLLSAGVSAAAAPSIAAEAEPQLNVNLQRDTRPIISST